MTLELVFSGAWHPLILERVSDSTIRDLAAKEVRPSRTGDAYSPKPEVKLDPHR